MFVNQQQSGLLVVIDKQPKPPKPPEHPARKDIRECLRMLVDKLAAYPQTTHGHVWTEPLFMKSVADAMADAYEEPTAFWISELSQLIKRILEQDRGPNDN